MSTLTAPPGTPILRSRRERRAERRRLKRLDALSAQLAELHAMPALLESAADIVRGCWVQGAWFSVATASGTRPVTAYDLHLLGKHPVVGACLVGAVVEAAGGPATVQSQLVGRTLDMVWHSLREDPHRPVTWCRSPGARMMTVLELTSWNDASGRTRSEVLDLLGRTRQTVEIQRDLCRAEQASLTAPEVVVQR